MVTARGRRELARTASWISVRSGLGWLIGVWVVLTLGSAGVQLQSMQLAAGVAAKDPGALEKRVDDANLWTIAGQAQARFHMPFQKPSDDNFGGDYCG